MNRYEPMMDLAYGGISIAVMTISANGDYVRYDDHIAYLTSFEEHHNAQVEELQDTIKNQQLIINELEKNRER